MRLFLLLLSSRSCARELESGPSVLLKYESPRLASALDLVSFQVPLNNFVPNPQHFPSPSPPPPGHYSNQPLQSPSSSSISSLKKHARARNYMLKHVLNRFLSKEKPNAFFFLVWIKKKMGKEENSWYTHTHRQEFSRWVALLWMLGSSDKKLFF